MLKDIIKDEIISRFIPIINTWETEGIYAISFYVYDLEDNPCKPAITLGFNTEEEVSNMLKYADEQEVRWNYAYWIQNMEGTYGWDDTSYKQIKEWVIENNFLYKENYNPFDTSMELIIELRKITEAFVQILIDVVNEIHSSGLITTKLKRDIPIIIHELEYYDKIVKQNIEANGIDLVKDFVNYINSLYQYNNVNL